MTQDKCTYTVRVTSIEASQNVRDIVEESNGSDTFSAEVTKEVVDEETDDGTLFEIEVHGDAYEIPVFEEELSECEDVTVVEGEVEIGKSKFNSLED
jgi:hypothetical protein